MPRIPKGKQPPDSIHLLRRPPKTRSSFIRTGSDGLTIREARIRCTVEPIVPNRQMHMGFDVISMTFTEATLFPAQRERCNSCMAAPA